MLEIENEARDDINSLYVNRDKSKFDLILRYEGDSKYLLFIVKPSSLCGCKPKILVVDDMEFNIIPVRFLLKQNYGLEIDDACNGKIAFEMFEEKFNKPCGCVNRAYRLIFMDIGMPVMNGIESSKKILKLMKDYNEKKKNDN